jgi:hypothetical protein
VPIEWLKFVELPEEVLPHVHFLLMAAGLCPGHVSECHQMITEIFRMNLETMFL